MEKFQISLAAARVNAGMTQEQAAEHMKVSRQTINNWERGKFCVSSRRLKNLSALYGIPIRFLKSQNSH